VEDVPELYALHAASFGLGRAGGGGFDGCVSHQELLGAILTCTLFLDECPGDRRVEPLRVIGFAKLPKDRVLGEPLQDAVAEYPRFPTREDAIPWRSVMT
jgi:hypothetical protein